MCYPFSGRDYQGTLPPVMAAKTQRMEITLPTELESVDLAESIVVRAAEAAGFDDENVHKLGIAVREAVINAYTYGNCQDPRKRIYLQVEFDPERMIVHIRDEGGGFELAHVPDPLAEENLLRTSGRGLFLVRAFVDDVAVRRAPGGGAELVLSKRLPPSTRGDRRH